MSYDVFSLFLPESRPHQRLNRQVGSQQHGTIWWQASRPSSSGLMPCRLSRRCGSAPNVSMATVSPVNISHVRIGWILSPWYEAQEDCESNIFAGNVDFICPDNREWEPSPPGSPASPQGRRKQMEFRLWRLQVSQIKNEWNISFQKLS